MLTTMQVRILTRQTSNDVDYSARLATAIHIGDEILADIAHDSYRGKLFAMNWAHPCEMRQIKSDAKELFTPAKYVQLIMGTHG